MSKVRQYYWLKKRHEQIGLHLKKLREQILEECEPGETQVGSYTVKYDLRKSKPKIDNGVLWELLTEKGILDECTSVQINEDYVKQAFIEGKITDEDLRAFNLGSTITPALHVELREVNDDVQTNDEGLG